MNRTSVRLLALAAVIHLAACGEARDLAAQQPSAFCPAAGEVGETVGFAVRVLPQGTFSYGAAEICAYLAIDTPGAFVSISVQPFDPDSDPIEEVRSAAGVMAGAAAEAIDVGDGGYAYGSSSKSEAAARKGDRVFHVDITATGAGVGDRKAAVIALLERVIR